MLVASAYTGNRSLNFKEIKQKAIVIAQLQIIFKQVLNTKVYFPNATIIQEVINTITSSHHSLYRITEFKTAEERSGSLAD